MGRCGRVQEAAGPRPKGSNSNKPEMITFIIMSPTGSHGLCPHFYNNAFNHDFYATENIYRCSTRRLAVNVPEFYKMGYMETRKK